MADETLPLDTPALLKLDPKVALTVIAGHHNGQSIDPDYVHVSQPTALEGRRTRVAITPNYHYQGTTGTGKDYSGQFDLVYNRLDYSVFFGNEPIEVELDLPSDTRALARALGALHDIAFSDDDVEMRTIGATSETATLSATPQSLRWLGAISINVLYTPSLFDVIPTSYLNGLSMFRYDVDIDVAFLSKGVLPLFDPFVPQPHLAVVLFHPALGIIPPLDLGAVPIQSYFQDTILDSHWVAEDNQPVIQRDLSQPESEILLEALNGASIVPLSIGDYEVVSAVRDIRYGRNTRVRLRGLAAGDLQGVVDVHLNRIDFQLVFKNALVDVDAPNGATEQAVRDAVLAQHQVHLSSEITASEVGDGTWVFTAQPSSTVFTGELTVEAYPFWDNTPQTNGFHRLAQTPYIVYDQRLATSWGPLAKDTPLDYTLGKWTARISAQETIEVSLNDDTQFVVLTQPHVPEAVDFTFMRNGNIVVVHEAQETLYLTTGSSQSLSTVALGAGTRPFINRLSWDIDRLQHDTYLFYTKGTLLFYRRLSDNFQIEYDIGVNNALAVLALNHDAMFRLVAHYLSVDGEIKNIATEGGLVSALTLNDYLEGAAGEAFTHS